MPRTIPLTQGKFAIVDDEDYGMLSRYHWYYVLPQRKGVAGSGYAVCGAFKTTRYMHRVIMLSPPKGLDVDHINGDGLDNRRENLRVVSHQQNCTNRHRLHAGNTSGKAGVGFEKSTNRWRAYIDNGRRVWLGSFKTMDAAVAARTKAELEQFNKTGAV